MVVVAVVDCGGCGGGGDGDIGGKYRDIGGDVSGGGVGVIDAVPSLPSPVVAAVSPYLNLSGTTVSSSGDADL